MKSNIHLSEEENAKLQWAWEIIYKVMTAHNLRELACHDKKKKVDMKVILLHGSVNDGKY